MLYYGDISNLSYIPLDKTVVYNITSYNENLTRLNLLPPIDKRLYLDNGRDFDMLYAQWIFSDEIAFMNFFAIVYNLFMNKDVFLVISSGEEDWSENIIESLLKLIQQRYGYNGTLITDFESYIYASNYINSCFDPCCLGNLDLDKNRYLMLLCKYDPTCMERMKNESGLAEDITYD